MSKLDGLTDRMRSRMTEARLGNLDRDNVRLRGEISVLRSELDHERSEREELRGLLRARPKTVKVRGRRPLLRVVVIGAGAYVLGARAGRERYEEILGWARSLRDRMQGRAGDVAGEIGGQMQSAAEDVRTKAGAVGQKVQDRAAGVTGQVQGKAKDLDDRVDLTRSELQTRP
jgi:hypothetical protein